MTMSTIPTVTEQSVRSPEGIPLKQRVVNSFWKDWLQQHINVSRRPSGSLLIEPRKKIHDVARVSSSKKTLKASPKLE